MMKTLFLDAARKGEQGGDGGGGELEQPAARRARVPRQVQAHQQHNFQAIKVSNGEKN